jgi:hypothetical protein
MMDAAFAGETDRYVDVLAAEDGTPQKVNRAGAWSFLRNCVEPYLFDERVKDEAMKQAGYE